jgi:FAD/FMN-containing dehydrogenase
MVFDRAPAAKAPTRPACREKMEAYLGEAMDKGLVLDAAIAQNEPQARSLWALARKTIPRRRSAKGLRSSTTSRSREQDPGLHDGGPGRHEEGAARLPAGAVRPCRRRQSALQLPGAGGLGQGEFRPHREAISGAVYDLVVGYGGSISAEHGIGRLKVDELAHYRSKIELDTMRRSSAHSIRRTS